MKTLLIVGCGSIGARHARNARTLGLAVALVDPDTARARDLAAELGSAQVFGDLQSALEESGCDAVLIASPSSFHVAQAKETLGRGLPSFIEKPLATSQDGLAELVSLASEKGVVTMMGQSYRFHETFLALKDMLDAGRIGHAYHAHFIGGQYLPDWHPGTDYRTEYMARSAQGGGVMFTSKSHTLDFVEWLFGEVREYAGWKDRLGTLELDVDDACFLLMKTSQRTVVYAEFDFLARPHRSRATITGDAGTIDADFIADTITITAADGTSETHAYAPDANARYVDELAHFKRLVDDGTTEHSLDIVHGKHIVDLMLDERVRDLAHEA